MLIIAIIQACAWMKWWRVSVSLEVRLTHLPPK